VAVNCGAIPSDLVENELFGHVRGAFTGAHASQPGLVFEANGGTLFLDDVDALPLTAQVKFLRFLQEKEYKQLGSTKTLRADIRVVSTTNTDLEGAVKIGKFRSDLFYRLNVIPLVLPSLRERMEDLPLLAQHFIEKYAYDFGKEVTSLSSDALSLLMAHDWSGNIRELENVMERAVVFCTGPVISPAHIILPGPTGQSAPLHTESLREAKAKMIAQFEKGYIEDLLRRHRGNISEAARAARKNRRAFWELLRKYKVNAETL
jgi:two-component system, NtrC family, response regulator GlrR